MGAARLGWRRPTTWRRRGTRWSCTSGRRSWGGRRRRSTLAARSWSEGYHHLFKSDTDILDLAEEIGLGDRVRWVPSSVGTLADGRIYDFVTPLDLLRFTPISLVDRVRLGLSTLQTRRISDWRALESHTAAEWLRRKAGQGAYDAFWGPMLRGKFGEHFQEVGMAWVWGKVHTRFASRDKGMAREVLGYPVGSFSEIFERLRVEIKERGGQVQTSSAVTGILEEGGRADGPAHGAEAVDVGVAAGAERAGARAGGGPRRR